MRVNVYAEELTTEVQMLTTVAATGTEFYGIRVFLESSDKLHFGESESTEPTLHDKPGDDDRSAITFWVPWTREKGHNFQLVAQMIMNMLNELSRAEDLDAGV
jgi:hypothetical protein